MVTEVLRPQQDRFSADRFHATTSFHGSRNIHYLPSPSLIANRRPYHCSSNGHHKGTSFPPKPDSKRTDGSRITSPPGNVTLLRRGESLNKGGLNKNSHGNNNSRPLKYPGHTPHDDVLVGGDHRKSRCDDVSSCGTRRIGPESFPKQIKLLPSRDVYAGSAFSLSPSPRSLPLPSFFGNNSKVLGNCNGAKMFEDSATNGLRRLLRLD